MAKLVTAFFGLSLILATTYGASAARISASDSGYCPGTLKSAAHMSQCQQAAGNQQAAGAYAKAAPIKRVHKSRRPR